MIDHIGIVCKPKELSHINKLLHLLGYHFKHFGFVKTYNVGCYFYTSDTSPEIEIVIPFDDKSAVSNYLKKNKNKLHHIAYKVKDITKFKNKLKPYRVKGAKPHMYVTFLDPKKYGLLIELVEYDY